MKVVPLLILIRHGECDCRMLQDRLFGQFDVPLTPFGYQQILTAGKEISNLLFHISLMIPLKISPFFVQIFIDAA